MLQDGALAGTHGPHHCIATASTVTDMIFRYLRARCSAQGGSLSFEDLDDAAERFTESVPSGFDLFESIHQRCMRASGSSAVPLFTRRTLLATLLQECGAHSAQVAFTLQTTQFGMPWLRHFFQGFACYIREAVCEDADYQLIGVYVHAAKKLKSRLSAAELLKLPDIQAVMRDCLTPITATTTPPDTIQALRQTLNQQITVARNTAEPDMDKVAQDDLRRFLALVRSEFEATLRSAVAA